MDFILKLATTEHLDQELSIVATFNKKEKDTKAKKEKSVPTFAGWSKDLKAGFDKVKASAGFQGNFGETFSFNLENGNNVLVVGLGDKDKLTTELLRRQVATAYKAVADKFTTATLVVDHFTLGKDTEATLEVIVEAVGMADYGFDKHLSQKRNTKLKKLTLLSSAPKTSAKKLEAVLNSTNTTVDAINFARDLVNEPPNILNSEVYAKEVEKDAKKLKRVTCKVLNKAQLKKENMNLFLSVNAGSAFEARLVHLTYTPAKANSKTKHIALVGKGLTFDTGGYSLKPGASMMNMKFDMAGSATVYAAFRAAVQQEPNIKISCYLGITDNAINSLATMPDSIIKARNGKTVEILNTDAEGRLVLADVLDYACDAKPNVIIDAATLTGAVLVALGNEICGLMGNDDKLAAEILKSAKAKDEYMWQLPVIEEFKNDMKSPIADLKNIGNTSFGGSAKAAGFLSQFVRDGISWAHLDIAGIGDGQGYLPYCPQKGASGLIVRTLVHYLVNAK